MARILAELKLLRTKVGAITMASGLINDCTAWYSIACRRRSGSKRVNLYELGYYLRWWWHYWIHQAVLKHSMCFWQLLDLRCLWYSSLVHCTEDYAPTPIRTRMDLHLCWWQWLLWLSCCRLSWPTSLASMRSLEGLLLAWLSRMSTICQSRLQKRLRIWSTFCSCHW